MEKVNSCQKELWEGLRSDTLEGSPSLVLFAELVTYSLPELLPATVFYGAMSFQPGWLATRYGFSLLGSWRIGRLGRLLRAGYR